MGEFFQTAFLKKKKWLVEINGGWGVLILHLDPLGPDDPPVVGKRDVQFTT